MAIIARKDLRPRWKGDSFKSVNFTLSNSLGVIDLTNVSTGILQFRYNGRQGPVIKECTIAGGGLTIPAPLTGVVTLVQFDDMDWDAGMYYYDLQLTWVDGTIKTYVYGGVKVEQDVSVIGA
jgi:hypothetical protein